MWNGIFNAVCVYVKLQIFKDEDNSMTFISVAHKFLI